MLIDIDRELFEKIKRLMKNRSLTIYEQLEAIEPIQTTLSDTLTKAREVKSQRVKETIKESIKELISQNMKPTRYQVHKQTSISYATLKKYFDELLDEVKKELQK